MDKRLQGESLWSDEEGTLGTERAKKHYAERKRPPSSLSSVHSRARVHISGSLFICVRAIPEKQPEP